MNLQSKPPQPDTVPASYISAVMPAKPTRDETLPRNSSSKSKWRHDLMTHSRHIWLQGPMWENQSDAPEGDLARLVAGDEGLSGASGQCAHAVVVAEQRVGRCRVQGAQPPAPDQLCQTHTSTALATAASANFSSSCSCRQGSNTATMTLSK